MKHEYSLIIPAYNEETAIGQLLDELVADSDAIYSEIIVVDDCSSDKTAEVVKKYPVQLLHNVQNFGYGYSLKRGISAAKGDSIIILDADGSYPPSAIATLSKEYEKGFDMVVGARHGVFYHGSFAKRIGRFFFRTLSEFATGRHIPDINSGFRVFRKDLTMRFFHTLSTGFSFTTTITLAFMLNAHPVSYVPIEYRKRKGFSKVRYFRDTLRSTQIITEAIVFYNPLKIYLLGAIGIILSGCLGILAGIYAPLFGLMLFLMFALAILMFGIGCLAVFMRFAHYD